jgi:hypothetical protein
MKKKNKFKKLPDFESEEEEREFWKTHDVREYINWDNASSFVDKVFRDKKKSAQMLKELKNAQK